MKRPLFLAVLAALLLSTAGCGSGSAADGPPDPNATVTVKLNLEPTSLDVTKVAGAALDQILIGNVYEGLVEYADDGTFRPSLADLPKVSDDGLTYDFTLRKATFHDGSPVTSADVKDSFDRVIADDSTHPAKAGFAAIKEVSAPDPSSVRIRLSRRDSTLLYALAGRAGLVLKKGATNDLATSENGSGPFRLQDWQRGSSITFVRHDGYWGPKAKVAKVVFRYIPDETSALNSLRSGEIDLFTSPTADQVTAVKDDPSFTIARGFSNTIYTLGFNNRRGPLKDPRVRHALRQAVDKKGLISTLGGQDVYFTTGSHTAPSDPWYEDLTSIDAYDKDNARKLLADAGYGTGLRLELTVPNIYPTAITDYLTARYKEAGVELKVNRVEFATWLDKVHAKADYELSLVAHVEPLTLLKFADPDYYWRYDSAEVRRLVTAALDARSDQERNGLLKQVARKVSEDAAADWILGGKSVTIARKGVTGFSKNDTAARLDLSELTATAR